MISLKNTRLVKSDIEDTNRIIANFPFFSYSHPVIS